MKVPPESPCDPMRSNHLERLLLLAVVIAGCGDDGPGSSAEPSSSQPPADVTAQLDVASDVSSRTPDVTVVADATADVVSSLGDSTSKAEDVASAGDAGSGVVADGGKDPPCPGGVGCPCTTSEDCDEPYCIETPDGDRCAKLCAQGCDSDETCLQTTGNDGKEVGICVPRWGRLCTPCAYTAECGAIGVKGAACVNRGLEGNFCGAPCSKTDDCPGDYACQSVEDVEGNTLKQCVHTQVACVCSKMAMSQKSSTKCMVKLGAGVCPGVRSCMQPGSPNAPPAGGLSSCYPLKGKKEQCDGLDNDCDGQVDEATCDDGNVCVVQLCQATTATSSGWACSTPKGLDCNDGKPCTADSCDKLKGCQNQVMADGAPCGNTDVCLAQKCVAKDMVLIPSGKSWLGCNKSVELTGYCKDHELPQHEVQLDAYLIDRYEVTNERYKKCVVAGGCSSPLVDSTMHADYTYGAVGKEKHPVVGVNWVQANAYCSWSHAKGRLPSEAEWEKAARGGCEQYPGKDCAKTTPAYPWGNQAPTCAVTVMLQPGPQGCTIADCGQGCKKFLSWPVGSKPKGNSPYGLSDMTGNVSEWVLDCYVADAYDKNKKSGAKNPSHMSCSAQTGRVLRGGGWNSLEEELRSADRHDHPPKSVDEYVGFRCARGAP